MKYIEGFCSSTRVKMEFLFPRLTEVLSTETPTQFTQEMSFSWNTSFIFSKMEAAVADFLPKIQNYLNIYHNTPY